MTEFGAQIGTVHAVHVGRVAPLGPEKTPSAFVKTAHDGPTQVSFLGLAGDEQADLSVHGGPDKAVYAYAMSHYPAWIADFPEHAARFGPGSVGENLAIDGMDEQSICIGDVHAIGSALLQACQPRQPCFKFALHFKDERLPGAMTRNGRSGWYYRVLQEGVLQAGDAVRLQARPNPDFAFTRVLDIISGKGATPEERARLVAMDGLAQQWRDILQAKLGS